MITIEHCPEKNCFVIFNDDIANNQGIKELNKLLCLEDIPIDKEAIDNVNMERSKQLNVGK